LQKRRECVLDVGVRADRHGTRCRDNCSTSCGARYTPQMQFIRTRQRGALPLFSTLPTSSTHSRNVTFGAPIRTGCVCRRWPCGGEAEAVSHTKGGRQGRAEGAGGGWRSERDVCGAANVTLGAANVTPYQRRRIAGAGDKGRGGEHGTAASGGGDALRAGGAHVSGGASTAGRAAGGGGPERRGPGGGHAGGYHPRVGGGRAAVRGGRVGGACGGHGGHGGAADAVVFGKYIQDVLQDRRRVSGTIRASRVEQHPFSHLGMAHVTWNPTPGDFLWKASQYVRLPSQELILLAKSDDTRDDTHDPPAASGGTIPKMTSVTIGRALQPFPRSKRSMRLSPHCAFQVGPDTHEGQIRGCPRGGAPVGQAYHHLLSSLHPFAPLSKDIPWRTFTLSVPLQDGIWLLRRLRPLSHTLAFSRPLAGQSGVRVPQFQTKKF